ncbi:MAG: type I restriction endonuclease subunit R [Methanomicrobiales archaeon]|nr:type I restriction endonuclease subunit R [Methanomicrobiales archaeon]
MTTSITEFDVEELALTWFQNLGYSVLFGPSIAPGEPLAERDDFTQVILHDRLKQAIHCLNPDITPEAREDAFRKVIHPDSPSLIINNRSFHRMLVDGVEVEYRRKDGSVAGDRVRLVDFQHPDENDWLVVNQFAVKEGQHHRRPDIVLFLNGLPLLVMELKNPADENATLGAAYNQLQTYKQQIPGLFAYNEMLVISDGMDARIGTLTANIEWFLRWRTIEGDTLAPEAMPELEVLVNGVCEKRRFLDLLQHFIAFEEDVKGTIAKKMAGYHQFHAVRRAVEATVQAAGPEGDQRCGVVWHTQGSGKSLTMVFYAGQIVLHPAMENPTVVVITDRNDLDDQLFGTFSRCHDLLRQKPVQAEDREHLRQLLSVSSGGVVFTTIQKFFPEKGEEEHPLLSDRRNIVVIADEAHRSQYGFEAKLSRESGGISYGFAKYLRDALPSASFIGFTGTPIELADKSTRTVFGDYISIYDVQQAINDGATVPIFYESRLAKLELKGKDIPCLDSEFEEVTEGEEETRKERLKTKWAALESVVGTEKRIHLIARDLVDHFEKRRDAMGGKAMVVCMSRRICVELYTAITALRPGWHDADDTQGAIKIVMTGSASDNPDWQPHIRNKPRREALARRFKDPADSFQIAIVRDMWLTGFDVPCLHTMYLDKPMQGHTLMQAIARVNRVYPGKDGGLIVDYLGLADQLRKAIANYTANRGRGTPVLDIEEAVAILLEKYEVCCDLFNGFDRSPWTSGDPQTRLALLKPALDFILARKDGKTRFLQAVTELTKAFGLAVPHPEALRIREDVAFFKAVRARLVKFSDGTGRFSWDLDHAIRQIVSGAIVSDEVVDVFAAAGLKKPDISILSEEFLAEVKDLPQKNLAVELLRKLLNDEIRARTRKNLVQSRSFGDMLDRTIKKYQNRAIETAIVIEELIQLAREMREAQKRGEDLGLTDAELAFYDALEVNDSAVKILGDAVLKQIAQELVQAIRQNISIDWTVRESVRARIRVMIKRILIKHGYPPDKQEKATLTVLAQAELLCRDLVPA